MGNQFLSCNISTFSYLNQEIRFAIWYVQKLQALACTVPEHVFTNDDIMKYMDTSDEWIQERTGIKERGLLNGKMKLPQPWELKPQRLPSKELA